MKKIILTESELITLIKQIIKEDGLLGKFYSENNFRNCRGVRLTLGASNIGSEGGMSRRQERINQRQIDKENKKEWNNFLTTNNISNSDLDFNYYLDLKNEMEMYNGKNYGYYDKIFNTEGKPFTDDMKQSNVNLIEKLMDTEENDFWFFYYKEIFGNKKPLTILDIYNHLKELGGKKYFEELTDKNYNFKKYKDILSQKVDVYNDNLKKQFPFTRPKEKTPFVMIWFYDKQQGVRYFNSYEELVLASEVAKTEGNVIQTSSLNPGGASGQVSLRNKPIGAATNAIFK